MKLKSFLIVLLLLTASFAFAQTLTYKSGGRVFNSENKKLSSDEVRELLTNKPQLLGNYNSGRSKKTIGNVLLIGGAGFILGDLAYCATSDVVYPRAITYLGLAAIAISIPVKIGYSKKIRTSVEEHNKQIVYRSSKIEIENASLYANQKGLGVRLSF